MVVHAPGVADQERRWLTWSIDPAPAWLGASLVEALPILPEIPVNYSQDGSLIIVCPAGYS